MVRVYLPVTLADVARLVAEDALTVHVATAVTAQLRDAVGVSDDEDLELEALLDAAELSLDLVLSDPRSARRRVVLAADVPDGWVSPAPELGPAAVRLSETVPLTSVVSAHVDEPGVEGQVDSGEVDDLDLLWYAASELPDLGPD